jgi:P-type Ca2+ transporter type 2C
VSDRPAAAVWSSLTALEAAARLGTTIDVGLAAAAAAERLGRDGPNELTTTRAVAPWRLLLDQFRNVLIVILLVAVALSAALGHAAEATVIGVIVVFAAVLGFVQEYRAERAIEALRRAAAPTAAVLRDGRERAVAARDVVPGDVLVLRTGDRVAADARLIEAVNLTVDEAALTGESLPVAKQTEAIVGAALAVGDRTNIVHAGTAVAAGRGRALVVATGMATEFGGIARLLETIERGVTPLQVVLDRIGSVLARAGLVVVVLVVGLGLIRGEPFLELVLFGIALAVAVVPEALPAVTTIALTLAAQRMARRNALVRRLPAIETLGCVSVICSDKTGTLTRNEMTVRAIAMAGREFAFSDTGATVDPPAELLDVLGACVLCSDAQLVRDGEQWRVQGDPTEGALLVAAVKAGLDKRDLEARCPRVHEIPFTAEGKRMTTLHTTPDGPVAFSKGAPEVVLAACTRELRGRD